MKNSRNKILAAVICGMVIGSVGTSIVGNFQSKNAIESAMAEGTSKNNNSTNTEGKYYHDGEGAGNGKEGYGRGQGGRGGHHKGAASLEGTESIDVASGNYKDGTYEGTADGFAQNLKVKVTISSSKISDIEIVSHNETPGFCEKAFETVPASIISKQSTDVDTVSGATYSSVGIINAVNDALENA